MGKTSKSTVAKVGAATFSFFGMEQCSVVIPEQEIPITIEQAPGEITPTPAPSGTPVSAELAAVRDRLRRAANLTQPVTVRNDGSTIAAFSSGSPSPLSNPAFYRYDSSAFRYVGKMALAGTSAPLDAMLANRAISRSGPFSSNQYFIEFGTTADQFELVYNGSGTLSAHRVLVDGAYVTKDVTAFGGQPVAVSRVTLPASPNVRWIRVEGFATAFSGVNVPQGDNLFTTNYAEAPVRAVILGDSYTSGTAGIAGVNHFDVWASQVARRLGWGDFYRSGIGGTGYSARGAGFPNFLERFDADVLPFAPEVLVVAGGYNDSVSAVGPAASALFDRIQATLPNTVVVVVGPWDPRTGAQTLRDNIRAAVGNRPNFYFFDTVADNWFAERATMIGADGVHPTQTGHDRIADEFVTDFKALVASF